MSIKLYLPCEYCGERRLWDKWELYDHCWHLHGKPLRQERE